MTGAMGRLASLALCAWALGAAAPAQAFVVEKVVSPGGVEAWLVESHAVPVIAVEIGFRGGAALDPEGREGVAEFVSVMLDEGAGDLDSQAFQDLLNENSIDMSFDAGRDDFRGSLYMLSENRDLGFELLGLALTKPRFDAEPVERMRAALTASMRRDLTNPDTIAGRAWWAIAYAGHPYGRPTSGALDTLAAMQAEDLSRFVAARFGRDNLMVGVVGDISAEELAPLLDSTFAALPEHAAPWDLPEVEMQGQGEVVVIDWDAPQSVIIWGQPGPGVNDEDYFPTRVANHTLGGGSFTSRLYDEVREKRGLVYGVGSYLVALKATGLVMGNAATANANVGQVVDLIAAEWARMGAEGPDADEVEAARLYLNGAYPLRYNNTASIASALVGYQFLGLPMNYYDIRADLIDAVSPADAAAAARDWFNPDQVLTVIVGRPEGVVATMEAPPPPN